MRSTYISSAYKTSHIEVSRKIWDTLSSYPSPGTAPFPTFSWGDDFPGACLRDWFLTCLNPSSNSNKKKTPGWETQRIKTAVYTNMEALAITPPHGSEKRERVNKVSNPKLVLKKDRFGPGIQCSNFYRGYWRGFCLSSLGELMVPGILDAWEKFGLVSTQSP